MSFYTWMLKTMMTRGDRIRDRKLRAPENVEDLCDIAYCTGDGYNLMDIHRPKHYQGKLPVIVSVHGGGYIYGDKEVYIHYCRFLASQGFGVVNFSYHLAPQAKFPTQLVEINLVMEWLLKYGSRYDLDLRNIFMVGDSAGAQLASHYCTILTNSDFASLFPFSVPIGLTIRALALNCGLYDISPAADADGRRLKKESGFDHKKLLDAYVGKDLKKWERQMDVLPNITGDFPPAFIMTSAYDFLRSLAPPMKKLLEERGVEVKMKQYGTPEQKYMAHAFHCNMNLQEAQICNREECTFFREHLQEI